MVDGEHDGAQGRRPEHVDRKLFAHVGEHGVTVLDRAMGEARAAQGGRAPYFVGIEMHDNDFFAEDSAGRPCT